MAAQEVWLPPADWEWEPPPTPTSHDAAPPLPLEAEELDFLSRPPSSPQRRSMEDYYEEAQAQFEAFSRRTLYALGDEPPAYELGPDVDAIAQTPDIKRAADLARVDIKLMGRNAAPGKHEGDEVLPPYSCSISIQNIFYKKMEYQSVVHKAHDRNWYKIFACLQGTALYIHKVRRSSLFTAQTSGPNISPDSPQGKEPGTLLKVYHLQHADVGIAADYRKRRYVIRLRVETDQFLLSCIEIETFLQWIDLLSAAINLAPPLEERKIPRVQSEPRTSTRRLRSSRAPVSEFQPLGYETRIIQEALGAEFHQRSNIIDTRIPEEAVAPPQSALVVLPRYRSEVNLRAPRVPLSGANSPETSPPTALVRCMTPSTPTSQPLSRENSPTISGPRLRGPNFARPFAIPGRRRLSSLSYPHSSKSPETGKWKPIHAWSPMHDLLYTKRCVDVLLKNSPRKTNLLVSQGKRWIIDWATGALMRCDPPGYGETDVSGPWGLAPSGLIVRI